MQKDQNGIYVNEKEQQVTTAFTGKAQDDLFDIEDNSWWFRYRAKIILCLLDEFFKKDKKVVDIGGGNGYTTLQMQKSGYDAGVLEPSYEACLNARRRGVSLAMCGTIGDLDFKPAQCTLLDVLEHIENDEGFLRTVYENTEPDGVLLITVPAFQCLWSSEDDQAGHFRRYTRKQLLSAVSKGGFEAVYCNYFFSFLFLPILLVRVGFEKLGILKRTEDRNEQQQKEIRDQQFRQRGGIVGLGLSILTGIEHRLVKKHIPVLFGSSIICVLRKKQA